MKPSVLVWLKRDLRIQDHPALTRAQRTAQKLGHHLIILYVYEPVVIASPDFDSRHLQFINDCLTELDQKLRALSHQLTTRKGKIRKVLSDIHQHSTISHLYSHEEAGYVETFARDIAVSKWCLANNVLWKELPQNGVIRRLKTRDGWAGKWAQRMSKPLLGSPTHLSPYSPVESAGILPPEEFSLTPPPSSIQRGGTENGYAILNSFLQERGMHYTRAMSSPNTGFDSCSRISPYLSWGALSVRECYHAVSQRAAELKDLKKSNTSRKDKTELKLWSQSYRSFAGRLRWHCHFMQKIEDLPTIHTTNFARVYDGIREEKLNEKYFNAWKEGTTGYPLVDACMRALKETGYLNFRMRAMVMSFASYHLWLHWRETGLYLARMFTDYEPGIHWSQVQMQSGTTGINSIRVYSPIKQTEEHDPDGDFIKRWVPELNSLPATYLSEPWNTPLMEQQFASCFIGKDYPFPIVEHKSAYRFAQETIRGLRKSSAANSEADTIQKKHGSRRKIRSKKD